MMACGLWLLILVAATSTPFWAAQEEEIILGKPSSIRPHAEPQETAAVPAGARLRERPHPDSAVIEILESSVELPVLAQKGSWLQVRFGAWLGWVRISGNEIDARLEVPADPDLDRLSRALGLLGDSTVPTSLGPFTLYTDVTDGPLLAYLSAVARGVLPAYRERFGLDPGPVTNEVVVLLAEEKDYRQFESTELRIAATESQGYTTEGLSILFTDRQSKDAIRAVLIHELTHLLNRRAFITEIPPWLEEGMAQDLAFCRVSHEGHIRLGTLSTVETHLAILLEDWNSSAHLDVIELLSLDPETFIELEGRPLRYSESAFLIRYLLDGRDAQLRAGFLRFLSQLTTSELSDSVSLFEELGSEPSTIESGFYRFLASQAKAY